MRAGDPIGSYPSLGQPAILRLPALSMRRPRSVGAYAEWKQARDLSSVKR